MNRNPLELYVFIDRYRKENLHRLYYENLYLFALINFEKIIILHSLVTLNN